MSAIYNRAKKLALGTPGLLLDTNTVKALLVGSGYVFNPDHNFVSDVNANEVSGTGYTGGFAGSGRKTLTAKAVAQDDTNDRGYFDAADVTWASINVGTVAFIVLYISRSSDADSELVSMHNTNLPKVTNGGDFQTVWSSSPLGIIQAA